MTDNEIIKAVAELDGCNCNAIGSKSGRHITGCNLVNPRNNYLISYDAIVPVIEKQIEAIKFEAQCYVNSWLGIRAITATPRQLCEALLRATGKWKD